MGFNYTSWRVAKLNLYKEFSFFSNHKFIPALRSRKIYHRLNKREKNALKAFFFDSILFKKRILKYVKVSNMPIFTCIQRMQILFINKQKRKQKSLLRLCNWEIFIHRGKYNKLKFFKYNYCIKLLYKMFKWRLITEKTYQYLHLTLMPSSRNFFLTKQMKRHDNFIFFTLFFRKIVQSRIVFLEKLLKIIYSDKTVHSPYYKKTPFYENLFSLETPPVPLHKQIRHYEYLFSPCRAYQKLHYERDLYFPHGSYHKK